LSRKTFLATQKNTSTLEERNKQSKADLGHFSEAFRASFVKSKQAARHLVGLKEIPVEMLFSIHRTAQQAFLNNEQLRIDIFIDWKKFSIQFVKYFLKNGHISEERSYTC
jgi:hypothetical protein